jgi:FkbM family methyltransferase
MKTTLTRRKSELAKLFIKLAFKAQDSIIKVNFDVMQQTFSCYIPDDGIWVAVKDILLNREYEYFPEFELCNFTGGYIVDCGAHVGLFSLIASVFAKKVVSIEPHPKNFRLLVLNLLANNISNVSPVKKALYPHKTMVKLFEGSHSGAHSLIKASGTFKEVETITLKEIIDFYGSIDLLKMDIEGTEFKVFNCLDMETIKQIKTIVSEIHLQHGNIYSIINKLRSQDFRIEVISPPIWKKNFSYRIKLHDMKKLKMLKSILYASSKIIKYKDKDLAILFAYQK